MNSPVLARLLAAFLLLSSAASAQNVFVVDAAGGAGSDTTTISAAIALAVDGDVVLVRSGDYDETVTIVNRSLVLQGDPGAGTPPTIGELVIRDLAAGKRVVVRRFDFDSDATPDHAIQLENDAGSVWLEELRMLNAALIVVQVSPLRASDCASVVVSRCTIEPLFSVGDSAPAMDLVRSNVHVFDSYAEATYAFFGTNLGVSGIRVEGPGATLGLWGSSVVGGLGELYIGSHGACLSYEGGPAVLLTQQAELVLQEANLLGGTSTCTGVVAASIAPGDGTVTELTSLARSHVVSSPVRDDASVTVTLEGVAGDQVWVFFASAPRPPLFRNIIDGPILLAAPVFALPLGTLPASGMSTMVLPIGDLGPGVSATVLFTQALFRGAGGTELVVSEPTAVTLLDASF